MERSTRMGSSLMLNGDVGLRGGGAGARPGGHGGEEGGVEGCGDGGFGGSAGGKAEQVGPVRLRTYVLDEAT